MRVFRRGRRVEAEDVDGLGHVNNAVWVRFIVELAEAHASSLGFGWRRVRELGGLWIVRRHEIDYRRPALPGAEIAEETWVASLRGARSIRHSRFCGANGELLVGAITQWAYTDSGTRRPKRIPDELAHAFFPKGEEV